MSGIVIRIMAGFKFIWRNTFPAIVGMVLLLASCQRQEVCLTPARGLTEAPAGFPEIPFPADNEFTQARWELGKKLFYDPILSIDSTISCGSCHATQLAFADDLAFSPGVENRPGTRNAPSLGNVAYHPYLLREGSNATLEMQILVPIQEHNELAHNIVDIALQLQEIPEYVAMSQAAYGRDPEPYVITRSIATFERTLITGNSSYDLYVNTSCENAFSEEEIRGMELFLSDKTNCADCHGGFNFTEYAFENNGLYIEYSDPGRFRFTGDSTDLARFKVPSLRNAGLTAPYMHDGSLPSLEAVVEHYNAGGAGHRNQSPLVRPLALSEQEKADLVAFLRSLTDWDFASDVRLMPEESGL